MPIQSLVIRSASFHCCSVRFRDKSALSACQVFILRELSIYSSKSMSWTTSSHIAKVPVLTADKHGHPLYSPGEKAGHQDEASLPQRGRDRFCEFVVCVVESWTRNEHCSPIQRRDRSPHGRTGAASEGTPRRSRDIEGRRQVTGSNACTGRNCIGAKQPAD